MRDDEPLADDSVLVLAARALVTGGAVIVPTDTVYGVAVSPEVRGATSQLFALKQRPEEQALAVLVASPEQGLSLADAEALGPDDWARVEALARRWWPGALTLVLPRNRTAAHYELGGATDTIGVRCPASLPVRALAERVGPLVTTSANAHGEPTPATAAEAVAALHGEVAVVVDGGPCTEPASTVLDVTTTPWRVLREGAVSAADLGVAGSSHEARS